MTRRFPKTILAAIEKNMVIGIRAGTKPHRFIAVWAVIAEGRVFIRSWSVKPLGWYLTFRREPRGTLQLGNRKIAIRAVHARSERLRKAVDLAYKEKYNTPGSLKYVRDLCSAKSRATTTELVPL
jgi:hypothetical protein